MSKSYIESSVKIHCNKDIVAMMKDGLNTKLTAKDIFPVITSIIVHLDFTNFGNNLPIFIAVQGFLNKNVDGYREYDRESIIKAIEVEWMPHLTEREMQQLLVCKAFIIDSFDENGYAVYKESNYYSYRDKVNLANPVVFGSKKYCSSLKEFLSPYIDWYKNKHTQKYMYECESYKWRLVKNFKEKYTTEGDDSTFAQILKSALNPSETQDKNNLFDGMVPAHQVLINIAELYPSEVKKALTNLFDIQNTIGGSIINRLKYFRQEIEILHDRYYATKGQNYKCNIGNDHNVSVLLLLNHPSLYYMYKETILLNFFVQTGIDDPKFYRTENCLLSYFSLCNHIREILLEDEEIKKYADEKVECIYNTNYHLLTQDFIYAIGWHYASKQYENSQEYKDYISEGNSFICPKY